MNKLGTRQWARGRRQRVSAHWSPCICTSQQRDEAVVVSNTLRGQRSINIVFFSSSSVRYFMLPFTYIFCCSSSIVHYRILPFRTSSGLLIPRSTFKFSHAQFSCLVCLEHLASDYKYLHLDYVLGTSWNTFVFYTALFPRSQRTRRADGK